MAASAPAQREARSLPGLIVPGIILALSMVLPLPLGGHITVLPPLCAFHALTGLPCPGCGLTRSFVCFAHGHWREAFLYHPAGPLGFLMVAAWLACAYHPGLGLRFRPWTRQIITSCVTIMVCIWVVRLAGWFPSPP